MISMYRSPSTTAAPGASAVLVLRGAEQQCADPGIVEEQLHRNQPPAELRLDTTHWSGTVELRISAGGSPAARRTRSSPPYERALELATCSLAHAAPHTGAEQHSDTAAAQMIEAGDEAGPGSSGPKPGTISGQQQRRRAAHP